MVSFLKALNSIFVVKLIGAYQLFKGFHVGPQAFYVLGGGDHWQPKGICQPQEKRMLEGRGKPAVRKSDDKRSAIFESHISRFIISPIF